MEILAHKTILIISPEAWSHLFVSKHHYAIELSRKNNKVYFLNPPTQKYEVKSTSFPGLFEVNYTPFPPGLRFMPGFLQRFFMRSTFKKIQKLIGTSVEVVWSFDNSVFFDLSFLPKHVLRISHIVDYAQNFQFAKASATANICFGVSQNIVDRLLHHNKNSYLIPHGVSLHHIAVDNIKLPGSNRVKAVYAGNLDSTFLHRSLLLEIIDNHPEIDFVFFGSGRTAWLQKTNVYHHGVVKPDELVSYLEKSDVLILTYDVEKYPQQLTNAHKILEYLYAGVVIVSTFMKDYESKPHLLEMSLSSAEYDSVFTKVIQNLPIYNSPQAVQLRKNYASTNSYAARLADIEKAIQITTPKF